MGTPGELRPMNNVQICQQSDSLSPNSDFWDKGVGKCVIKLAGYLSSSTLLATSGAQGAAISVCLSVMVISCPEINLCLSGLRR